MALVKAENGSSSAIRYKVLKHPAATKAANREVYCAYVRAPTKSLREVAETMAREGGKYHAREILAILESFAEVVARLLCEGNAVNVGSLVRFCPAIRGTFASRAHTFCKSLHRIVINATIGSALRNVAAHAAVYRVNALRAPIIGRVFNLTTGERDVCLSEGNLLLVGERLIWNDAASDEGFFVTVGAETLRCEVVSVDATYETAVLRLPCALTVGEGITLAFTTRNTPDGARLTVLYGTEIVCVSETDKEEKGGSDGAIL